MHCDEIVINDAITRRVNLEMELLVEVGNLHPNGGFELTKEISSVESFLDFVKFWSKFLLRNISPIKSTSFFIGNAISVWSCERYF